MAKFLAANKQKHQRCRGPGNKAWTSKSRNYRMEVAWGKLGNNEKRKQDSDEEDETLIHASTTASSSDDDDFQDNSKGPKSKEK